MMMSSHCIWKRKKKQGIESEPTKRSQRGNEELFTGDESIESIASVGTSPEPEPATEEPAPAQEAPAEAPPLPASGLPDGWTMDQWKWYGHEYLAKYGDQ
jgi:hypothetical protein